MKSKTDALVVLGCIVFLLANIAAVGPAGRSRAKEAACLSNLLKWGQIFQAYTADNDGYFHSRTIGTAEGYKRFWIYTYEPYYVDRMMCCCPAADNPRRDLDTFSTWGGPDWPASDFGSWEPDNPDYCGPNPPYYGSYGLNHTIINRLPIGLANNYWKRAGAKGADNIPVLLDCMYVNLYCDDDDQPPPYEGDISNYGISWSCINRHDGHVNVLFMDFSARKVGLKELWTLKYHRFFDTCNYYTICGHGGNKQSCAAAWDAAAPWMSEFPEY